MLPPAVRFRVFGLGLEGGVDAAAEVLGAEAEQSPSGDGYEVSAEFDEFGDAGGVSRVVAADTDIFAGGADAGDGVSHYFADLGLGREAHTLAEVAGGDVEDVDAGNGGYIIQVGYGGGFLDHRDDQDLGVDPSGGLVAGYADAVVVGAAAAHSPMAVGMVAGGLGYGGGLGAAVDMGDDDALQAAVEEAKDGGVVVVGDAGNGGDAEGFGGPHHIFDLVEVHRAVFAVNHNEVEAEGAENFDGVRGVAGDDSAEYGFAGGQFGFGGVGLHWGIAPGWDG